jgi:DnaJ-class molecular chaperone
MSRGETPWQVLGIPEGSDEATVRRAWRELARAHHPDAGGIAAEFQRIQAAFEQITGKQQPRRSRTEPARTRTTPTTPPPADFDETVLDGETGERVTVEVSVEQRVAVFGGTVQVTRWRQVHCPACFGRGTRCRPCDGDGRVGRYHGTEVSIPPRSRDGDVIKLRGAGDAGRRRRAESGAAVSAAGPYGDLEIRIGVVFTPNITEVGDDLHTTIQVGLFDALLGCTRQVRNLDGSIALVIPAGTQPGARLRVQGRGRPRVELGRGDFVAEVLVSLPTDLTAEERAALAQMRDVRGRTGGPQNRS